jgi:hypothetical protein
LGVILSLPIPVCFPLFSMPSVLGGPAGHHPLVLVLPRREALLGARQIGLVGDSCFKLLILPFLELPLLGQAFAQLRAIQATRQQ